MPTIIYKKDPFHYYRIVEGEKVEQYSSYSYYEQQKGHTFYRSLLDSALKAANVDASEAEAVLQIINQKTKTH